jgi:hypothetical protein
MSRSPSAIGLPLVDDSEVPLYTGHLNGRLEEHLRTVARNRLAETITGGLSQPGKMPCPSWGISAARCRIGAVLAEKEGTVCHDCYARKRNYLRDSVQSKLEERFEGLSHELWTPAMIFLVRYFCDRYFRLFDSGDLQGRNHLRNLVTLASHVPDVKIWLPTRELETVRAVRSEIGEFPENLIVRISSNKVDGAAVRNFQYTSAVVTDQADATCVAQLQGNKCDGEMAECRACWTEKHVTYPLH